MPATQETAKLVADNWQQVVADVAQACSAAGRSASEVTIVGVSKYVDAEYTYQLLEAGCQHLGENRPQLLWEKAAELGQRELNSTWHMIGHLQRNKVRRTLPLIALLHSVDSLRLAEAVSDEAGRTELTMPILVDVNVTADATKTGLSAEALTDTLPRILQLPGVRVDGLMAMSSLHGTSDDTRREFAAVRELRDRLQHEFGVPLPQLSMGMSGDFVEAIREGATIVRIGSSLWKGIL